jgi:hypothetical protein
MAAMPLRNDATFQNTCTKLFRKQLCEPGRLCIPRAFIAIAGFACTGGYGTQAYGYMLVNQILLLAFVGAVGALPCALRLRSDLPTSNLWQWSALDAFLAQSDTRIAEFQVWRDDHLPDVVSSCGASNDLVVLVYGRWIASVSMFVHEVRRFSFALRPTQAPPVVILLPANESAAFSDPEALPGLDGVVKFTRSAVEGLHVSLEHTNERVGYVSTLRAGLPGSPSQRMQDYGEKMWNVIVEFRDVIARSANRPRRPRLGLVYFRPTNGAIDESEFEGGFVTAMNKLQAAGLYDITWLNAIDVETGKHNNLDPDRDFDVLAFKSNWEWIVDRWARLTFSPSLNVRWQKSVVQVYRDGVFFECTRLVVLLLCYVAKDQGRFQTRSAHLRSPRSTAKLERLFVLRCSGV